MKVEAGLNNFEDYSPLPPGKYTFAIKEVPEVETIPDEQTDIGGRSYRITVVCEVVEGEHSGKTVRRTFVNRTKGTRYFLHTFLVCLGVPIDETGAFRTEDLVGKKFSAVVSERGYTDANGNERKAADLNVESVVLLGGGEVL
ncbi:MAG: hypothetical protein DRH51_06945 [Candidatus Coatesbacteria bacterium]|nr:MAG: hypothetical protein DRH51_06945 [Candidatus Coatesbacteria bacterium]